MMNPTAKKLTLFAASMAILGSGSQLFSNDPLEFKRRPIPEYKEPTGDPDKNNSKGRMTPKQKKARNKSKAAKQARKKNRK